MAFINWNDSYNVGISAIDNQHKELVGMIGDLYESMVAHKSREVLAKSFHRLDEYILSHFTTEEYYMQLYNYPSLEMHKQQHNEFTAQIGEFKKRFSSGKAELTLELTKFLKEWLLSHIKTYDPLYVPHLKKMGA